MHRLLAVEYCLQPSQVDFALPSCGAFRNSTSLLLYQESLSSELCPSRYFLDMF